MENVEFQGTATVEDVLSWDPCDDYTERHIRELAEGLPERFTAVDLVRHLRHRIPSADLLWLLCRKDLLPARLLRECACDWAERALHLAGVTDWRPWKAVEVSRRYARGEATIEELTTARNAAWDAAWAPLDNPARGCAKGAAWSCGNDAGWGAAQVASWGAVVGGISDDAKAGMAADLCDRVLDGEVPR